MGYAIGRGGVVTDGIRALIELVPGEDSRTVGIGLLSVEQISIVKNIRYVCRVRISKVVDFLSSGELLYFFIPVPEYQRVIPL